VPQEDHRHRDSSRTARCKTSCSYSPSIDCWLPASVCRPTPIRPDGDHDVRPPQWGTRAHRKGRRSTQHQKRPCRPQSMARSAAAVRVLSAAYDAQGAGTDSTACTRVSPPGRPPELSDRPRKERGWSPQRSHSARSEEKKETQGPNDPARPAHEGNGGGAGTHRRHDERAPSSDHAAGAKPPTLCVPPAASPSPRPSILAAIASATTAQ